MNIDIGEWLPDLPALGNPGVTEALNVAPSSGGYRQVPAFIPSTAPVPSRIIGTFTTRSVAGDAYFIAGTVDGLHHFADLGSPDDVSKAGGYNGSDSTLWAFAQWENSIIATNYADPPQRYDMDGSSTDFADLSGSPPRGRHIARVKDQLWLGDLYRDGAAYPYEVSWSNRGNPEDWNLSTQAGREPLKNGQPVTGLVGGKNATIFSRDSITIATFVGYPGEYAFDTITESVGTKHTKSIVKVGSLIFFLSDDGFYVLNGSQVDPIGANRVNKQFLREYLGDGVVWGAVDPVNEVIFWGFPTNSGRGPAVIDRIYAYNYSKAPSKTRWSRIDADLEILGHGTSNTSSIDADFTAWTIDTIPYSLDSAIWGTDNIVLGGGGRNHQLGLFSGAPIPATITTGEVEPLPGRLATVQRFTPVITGNGYTLARLGSRLSQSRDAEWSSYLIQRATGDFTPWTTDRYHRISVEVFDGFDSIDRIDLTEITDGGQL